MGCCASGEAKKPAAKPPPAAAAGRWGGAPATATTAAPRSPAPRSAAIGGLTTATARRPSVSGELPFHAADKHKLADSPAPRTPTRRASRASLKGSDGSAPGAVGNAKAERPASPNGDGAVTDRANRTGIPSSDLAAAFGGSPTGPPPGRFVASRLSAKGAVNTGLSASKGPTRAGSRLSAASGGRPALGGRRRSVDGGLRRRPSLRASPTAGGQRDLSDALKAETEGAHYDEVESDDDSPKAAAAALDRRGSLGSIPGALDRRGSLGSIPGALDRRGSLGSIPGALDRRDSIASITTPLARSPSRGGIGGRRGSLPGSPVAAAGSGGVLRQGRDVIGRAAWEEVDVPWDLPAKDLFFRDLHTGHIVHFENTGTLGNPSEPRTEPRKGVLRRGGLMFSGHDGGDKLRGPITCIDWVESRKAFVFPGVTDGELFPRFDEDLPVIVGRLKALADEVGIEHNLPRTVRVKVRAEPVGLGGRRRSVDSSGSERQLRRRGSLGPGVEAEVSGGAVVRQGYDQIMSACRNEGTGVERKESMARIGSMVSLGGRHGSSQRPASAQAGAPPASGGAPTKLQVPRVFSAARCEHAGEGERVLRFTGSRVRDMGAAAELRFVASVREGVLQAAQDGNPNGGSYSAIVPCQEEGKEAAGLCVKVMMKGRIDEAARADDVAREVEALRALTHPNIVRLVAARESPVQHLLVMQRAGGLGGASLRAHLAEACDGLGSGEALDIVEGVVLALEYCHRNGLAHRAVCPEHVVFDRERRGRNGTPSPVLCGFGHCAGQQDGEPVVITLHGTCPEYNAPELVLSPHRGAACYIDGFRVDQWCAGLLLGHCLTGAPLFRGDDTLRLNALITSCSYQLPAGTAPDAAALIRALVCADPAQRLTIPAATRHPYFGPQGAVAPPELLET